MSTSFPCPYICISGLCFSFGICRLIPSTYTHSCLLPTIGVKALNIPMALDILVGPREIEAILLNYHIESYILDTILPRLLKHHSNQANHPAEIDKCIHVVSMSLESSAFLK